MNLNCVLRVIAGLVSVFTMKRAEACALERGDYADSLTECSAATRLRRLLPVVFLVLFVVPVSFAENAADNVVIVLDGSGSMASSMPGGGANKMTAAKAALKQVLSSVPQNTRIGLLVFSASGGREDWIYPLGPRDDAKLMQAIDSPRPGRGTPLGAYLKKGADRLLEERARQFGYGTFRLLVVTDGEAEDQKLVDRYTPEIVARGITVDVIGVAMNQRHTLATRVHSYRPANDPASLTRAIAEVFGEVGGLGNDVASAEAFAELKPIPSEVAQAMIQTLSSSGNHPVGERPPKPTPTPISTPNPPAPTPAAVSSSPPTPQEQTQPAPVVVREIGPGWRFLSVIGGFACVGAVGLVVIVLVIRNMTKKR